MFRRNFKTNVKEEFVRKKIYIYINFQKFIINVIKIDDD